jgi:hypothetical protein
MGFTLAAQRIAEIDKRALQGSWMFLMRQTQTADFREYQKFGISPEEAMGLLDGEAFVFTPGKPRERHRLRVSNSPHGGVTPGMEALRGSTQGKRGTPLPEPEAQGLPTSGTKKQAERSGQNVGTAIDALLQLRDKVDEKTFLALLKTLPGTNMKEEEHAETTRKLPDDQVTDGATTAHPHLREVSRRKSEGAANLRHPAAGLPQILQVAYDAYVPGMTYRELGAALGYGDREAREVFLELKRRGLLRTPAVVTERVEAAQGREPHLRPVPRSETPQGEDREQRAIDPTDLAKAFALWQAGASSVRKLEAAAKAASYGWSNGKVRAIIDEMENCGLVQKREPGVM